MKFDTVKALHRAIRNQCIEMHAKGMSNLEIARALTKAGYRTPRDRPIPDTYVSVVLIDAGHRQYQTAYATGAAKPKAIARTKTDSMELLTDLLTSNLNDRSKRALLKQMGLKL
jgi:hypothetical protein